MHKKLLLLAALSTAFLTSACGTRTSGIDVGNAVSELDRAIWQDGLKPIVPAADKPSAPKKWEPLK